MVRDDVQTDAEARYLAQIMEDCEGCLGPGTELLDVRREPADEGVRLGARYRLGGLDRESAAGGETIVAGNAALRAAILLDRIRFGISDLVKDP